MDKVTVPTGSKGEWVIERRTIKRNPFCFSPRFVPDGEYTGILRNGKLVMSDTPDEMRDHSHAVYCANGKCLVAGLGIGMVLQAICKKKEVKSVDVVEISQDVIDLVSPHYSAMFPGKINFICSSIFDFKMNKGESYDWAWFDIWDDICSNNLKEMELLARRFGRKIKWKGYWAKELCKRRDRFSW